MGVRPLSTRDGTPTNAVYGFLNILLKLLEEENPDALCVTFDRKAPTFRHLAYEGYKAQRKGMPEELAQQMPILKAVLEDMNIPLYELDGWEADDLIGTIAARDTVAGWDTVVVTGDKDSLQLITAQTRVKLVSTRMGQTTTKEMTPAAFQEAYGFAPIHMVDLKALMGDASDNIPGVKGIGEKTATDLIQRYGSVEAIYSKLESLDIKPAVLKKLTEGVEQAKLSYELATIHCDAPISFAPEDAVRKSADAPALYQRFLNLEFTKLIDKMGLKGTQGIETVACAPSVDYKAKLVEDGSEVDSLLMRWENTDHVTLLTLPSLDGVAVLDGLDLTFVLQRRVGAKAYQQLLEGLFSEKIRKVTHECKDLMGRLLEEGLKLEGFIFDTAIAAYLLAPTDGSYALEKLAVTYFNTQLPPTGAFANPEAFGALADPAVALKALCAHTAMVEELYHVLSTRLRELHMWELYETVELPLCPVLARMEREGFLVDRRALADFGTMLNSRLGGIAGEYPHHGGGSL